MRLLPSLAAIAALALSAAAARAQCTELPNTGCPGALAPQCSGSTKIGSTLTLTCINNGRFTLNWTMVGVIGPTIYQLTGVTCFGQTCGVAVDPIGVIALQTNYQPLNMTIPNDPSLIGKRVIVQCADMLLPNVCVTVTPALDITFTQ